MTDQEYRNSVQAIDLGRRILLTSRVQYESGVRRWMSWITREHCDHHG